MPSVAVEFPKTQVTRSAIDNPLPQMLHTPSGLAIIEIQGTIHTPSSNGDENGDENNPGTQDTAVGRLEFPLHHPGSGPEDKSWMKRVYLYIGKHQRLTGEVKQLAKPLAVIRQIEGDDNDQATSTITDDASDGPNQSGSQRLEIAEIIKYKILFATRPEPVGVVAEI